jgi:hypothetical protein
MKLINLYKEWMKKGVMPDNGLCSSLKDTKYYKDIDIFIPFCEDKIILTYEKKPTFYWGNGEPYKEFFLSEIGIKFTPLRQTIVLLICAMHNEI